MMMRSKRGGGGIVVYGSAVLDSDTITLPVTHILDSLNYYVSVRNRATVYNENYANGAVAIGTALPLFMKYKTGAASSYRSVASMVYESRVGNYAFYPPNSYLDEMGRDFGKDSLVFYPRSYGYRWKAGTYDWVAIDLDSTPDAQGVVTLDRVRTVTVEHGLGTTDFLMVFYATSPMFERNGYAGAFYDPWNKAWYAAYGNDNLTSMFTFNTSANYVDWAALNRVTAYGTGVTPTTFTLAQSFNGSLLSDGEWVWKAWKIKVD